MQGQDAHHVLIFAQGFCGFAVVRSVQAARFPQESAQALLGAFALGPLCQQAQIGLAQFSFLQGPGPHIQPAFLQNAPNQRVHGHVQAHEAPEGQPVPGLPAFFTQRRFLRHGGAEGFIKGRAGDAFHQPDAGQILLCKGEAGAPQGGKQRDILQRIIHHLQQIHHIHHFRQIEKLRVGVAVYRDALGLQRPGDIGGPAGGIAHQQGDVPEAHGTAAIALPHGRKTHQLLDPLGHKGGFVPVTLRQLTHLPVLVLLGGDQVNFHGGAERLAPAGPQHGGFIIGDFRFLFPHGVNEYLVHGQQHVFIGTEILLEQDFPFRRVRGEGIALILVQKQGGIGQAKAVNTLLHIAHHEQQVRETLVQRVQNGFLDPGNILILIDKQRVKAARHGGAHIGLLQHLQGQMLQVVIIQIVAGLLERIIPVVHFMHQAAQGPQGGQGMAQFFFRLIGILRKQLPGIIDPVLPILPQGLEPGGGIRILVGRSFFGAEPGKGRFAASQRAVL